MHVYDSINSCQFHLDVRVGCFLSHLDLSNGRLVEGEAMMLGFHRTSTFTTITMHATEDRFVAEHAILLVLRML